MVEAWAARLMHAEGAYFDKEEMARRWFDEEYSPVLEMIDSAGVRGPLETGADAYIRVAGERYRLIREHAWNNDVMDMIREQQQRARRQVLAKHDFHHRPAGQCCDQGPVPRPPVRGISGSRFGPQRAECAGGHPVSLGNRRARCIHRKYESSAVPRARSNQAPGLMCPPPAFAKVETPTRSRQGAFR